MVNEIGLNDRLPSFNLEATIINICSENNFLGQWNVLFVYPKDNTSGCTKETREFNELFSELKALRVGVFGLSKDTMASHIKFSDKLDLQFPLISDPNTQLIQDLGCWKEKSMYGKKYMGAERSSFLIDENLIIKHTWRKVKVVNHVNEVLLKVKELVQ